MITLNKKVNNAIKLEELRNKYATINNLVKFKSLYKKTNPEIINSNTSAKWDSKNFDSSYSPNNNPMGNDRINQAISFINVSDIRILDIGFGPADFEERLNKIDTKKAIELDGIDISRESSRKAQKLIPRWHFSIGSIVNQKFNTGIKYDYVVMLEVMEHISPKNTFSVLKKISNILKTDGKLIISIPLNEPLFEMIKNGSNPNAHVRIYTKNVIGAELKLMGFEIKETNYLFAFHKHYRVKSILNKLFKFNKKPNNLIILAQKI